MITYEVDPALEYRTFAQVSLHRNYYQRPAIRHDGRVLAVGTGQGVALGTGGAGRDRHAANRPG